MGGGLGENRREKDTISDDSYGERGTVHVQTRGRARARHSIAYVSIVHAPPPVMQPYIPVSELWGAVPGTNTGLNLGAGSWWAPIPDGLNIE
jgi:hypothetical protein